MAKKFVCIICPNSCEIEIDDQGQVSGAKCKRGIEFAEQELAGPARIVTTTILCKDLKCTERIPVKTIHPIPLADIAKVMLQIKTIVLNHKPALGDILDQEGVSLVVTGE